MKKSIWIINLLLCLHFPVSAQKNNHLGLLNRLIDTKYSTELYLYTHCTSQNQKDSALAIYNELRWKVDGFIYQLSADMIMGNSPRKMRLLNKWCLTNKTRPPITTYTFQINEIEKFYTTNIRDELAKTRTLNLTTNVFYFLKDSWTILNGLSDIKAEKTMALVNLLDQTRLSDPLLIIKQIK
ncbi:MAG: hypothetical protein NT104_01985 [Bacteroidetes bacterium]|nr:hypothetical protein [Bacteroidota bacterium]